MKSKCFIILVCLLILSGCWDEKQLKDVTLVSLLGLKEIQGK